MTDAAQVSPALALAHEIDPAAFEVHPAEARSHVAALQWAARRKMAYDAAGKILASDWLAAHDRRVRASALREARTEIVTMLDGFKAHGQHTRARWAVAWLGHIIDRIEGER